MLGLTIVLVRGGAPQANTTSQGHLAATARPRLCRRRRRPHGAGVQSGLYGNPTGAAVGAIQTVAEGGQGAMVVLQIKGRLVSAPVDPEA